MNITINQEKLLTALRIVERLVSKNVSLPILSTILLKTDDGRLRLSATNLEAGVNYWVGVKVDEEGEIAIPAHIFSDFMNNVADERVNITANRSTLVINSEHYKTQILGMEAKDFPIIPKVKKEAVFKIDGGVLKDSLASVFDSTSISETRPELSGVYVSVSESHVEFAATDSFRLSEKVVPLKGEANKSFIIPRNAVAEIMRILENLRGEVVLSVSENQVFVYNSDLEFISRLVDGRYPEYKKVIPDRFLSLVKINRTDFEKNVRMASVFSSSILDVKLKATAGTMEISAKNSDRGETTSHMECELKNKPFEISVNYHYLLDGLKIMPAGDVTLEFTGEGSPLVLRGENQKDQTYVIMPLKG